MAIYRIKHITDPKDFCILPTALLHNPQVSSLARGVLASLLSQPEDGEVQLRDLVTATDDAQCVRTALQELVRAGSLTEEETA
jgi:hypothetical protein